MSLYDDEKRDFYRMPVDCDVSFTLPDSHQQYLGKGSDLSAEGLLFYTQQELQLGDEISIHVYPYIPKTSPLFAKAVVMRSERKENEFIIGVKFLQVS